MDNISPLAKTLAESNGIDWRTIQGSGAGGQIIEQDIINYLTRVMSGEEEPPATPVDLPPPDWTGDELPAGMSAEMLSQAGVESDIAALVNQAPLAQAPAGQGLSVQDTAAQGAAGQSAQLEEDEFELDLEDEAAPVGAPEVSAPAPVAEPVQPAPAPAAPAASGGLGGLLSQLYQAPGASAQPATPPAYGQTSAFADTAARPAPEHPSADQVPAAQEMSEPASAQAEATRPAVPDAPSFTDERAAAQAEEIVAATITEAPSQVAAPSRPTERVEPAPVEAAPAAQAPAEPAQPVVSAPVQAAPAERPERAVWFGVYLRRDADLQAAASLREQLNTALGQDVPLSLLVARAAQQHAGMLNLNAVAIQDVHSQRARSVGAAGDSLRTALSALDRDHDGQADLLVVNAGTFDLDELHYPDTVTLSLGRMVDGRAALSLNGEMDTAQAAQFLAAVAASLEAPVALIV